MHAEHVGGWLGEVGVAGGVAFGWGDVVVGGFEGVVGLGVVVLGVVGGGDVVVVGGGSPAPFVRVGSDDDLAFEACCGGVGLAGEGLAGAGAACRCSEPCPAAATVGEVIGLRSTAAEDGDGRVDEPEISTTSNIKAPTAAANCTRKRGSQKR